ncbi:MAG: hypothetical protein ACI8Q1_000903 [Parvicella sp.]|jgi:hypothetical protein
MQEDSNIDIKTQLVEGYLKHLLRQGKPPVTVFRFCDDLGVEETEFYNHFPSFKSLEKSIWTSFFTNVNDVLSGDENYTHYSVYEKWLSFMYTVLEEFKGNRSLVVLRCSDLDIKDLNPWFLSGLRALLGEYAKDLINSGLETDEIATRPIITAKYNEVLWFQFLYVLRVWINDESEDFQVTDAAVEKSSALLFEMMKRGPVDLLIDFGKFIYQNKAY